MFEPETETPGSQPAAAASDPAVNAAGGGGQYPFDLAPGEAVLRTYSLLRYTGIFGRVAGYLFVTDSRVIYASEAQGILSRGKSYEDHLIQDVAGVGGEHQRGLRPLVLLLGLIFTAGAFLALGVADWSVPAAIAGFVINAVIAALFFLNCRRTKATLVLHLRSGGDRSSIAISGGSFFGRNAGTNWTVVARVSADPAMLDAVIGELSALVMDIQARGTFAGK